MRTLVVILPLLLLCEACQTHSQCRRELFQSYLASANDAYLTAGAADKLAKQFADNDTTDALREHGINGLAESLSELQKLTGAASKDDRERLASLVRAVVGYEERNRVTFARCQCSLKVLVALKGMPLEPTYMKRVTELEHYVKESRKDLPLLER